MVLVHCMLPAIVMLHVLSSMMAPSKTIKLRCSCVDPLYVTSMCEATSCAHLIDSILCGSTVLQVSSNYLSPDSDDPLYLACLCYMWHALLTKLSCDSMDPQYWICICEVSCIFHGHYMYMYWFQPLCGYISQNWVQMVLVHSMVPAIVMLHVLSIQNNQIEMQLCGATVCDIYVKLQPFELSWLHPVWIHCAACQFQLIESILCGSTVLHVSSN